MFVVKVVNLCAFWSAARRGIGTCLRGVYSGRQGILQGWGERNGAWGDDGRGLATILYLYRLLSGVGLGYF